MREWQNQNKPFIHGKGRYVGAGVVSFYFVVFVCKNIDEISIRFVCIISE